MGQINQQILDFFMFVFICPMAELVTASDCYPSGRRYRKVVSSSLTGAELFHLYPALNLTPHIQLNPKYTVSSRIHLKLLWSPFAPFMVVKCEHDKSSSPSRTTEAYPSGKLKGSTDPPLVPYPCSQLPFPAFRVDSADVLVLNVLHVALWGKHSSQGTDM
jgi:hypothetical protein